MPNPVLLSHPLPVPSTGTLLHEFETDGITMRVIRYDGNLESAYHVWCSHHPVTYHFPTEDEACVAADAVLLGLAPSYWTPGVLTRHSRLLLDRTFIIPGQPIINLRLSKELVHGSDISMSESALLGLADTDFFYKVKQNNQVHTFVGFGDAMAFYQRRARQLGQQTRRIIEAQRHQAISDTYSEEEYA